MRHTLAGKRSICTLAPARLFALSSSPRGALLSSSDVHGTLVCLVCCQLLSGHVYLIYFALGNTQNIVQTCPNCPLVIIGWLIQFSILQADIFWSAILLLYKNVCVGFAAWILTLAVGSFKFWSAFLP